MAESIGSECRHDERVACWIAEAAKAARRAPSPAPGGPSAAEDLAQEALARMLEHPPARGNAGAWIERICRNLRIDGWRAQARSHLAGERLAPVCAAPASTGEDAVLARERRRVVRRGLVSLPRPLRRALILRFFGGWSFDRIGARLGLPEATARTRTHRALAALRARVAALRVVILPQLLPMKAALAVAIVLAADPRALPPSARRVVPSLRPAPIARAAGVARSLAQASAAPASPGGPAATHSAGQPVDAGRAPRATREHPAAATENPLAVRRYDFENDRVEGELSRPDDSGPIWGTTRAAHPSLIEIRPDFQVEIVKTLEDL